MKIPNTSARPGVTIYNGARDQLKEVTFPPILFKSGRSRGWLWILDDRYLMNKEVKMIQRFAAGSMVAAVVLALAVFVVLLIPALTVQRMSPLITIWCFAPAAWGLWALIAPKAWVPHRLPLWGAILGLIAGVLAAFVLNLPLRVFGQLAPVWLRGLGLLFLVVFYFLLWMLVRAAYRSLVSAPMSA